MATRRVTSKEFALQRAAKWPDFHPEDFCHQCGNPNATPWHVDHARWMEAVADLPRGVLEILCPSCFTRLWRQKTGRTVIWELRVMEVPTPSAGSDPS